MGSCALGGHDKGIYEFLNVFYMSNSRTCSARFLTGRGDALRLVDSGELRLLVQMKDILPKPWVFSVVWATADLIETNPDLVGRFVIATLETVKYLKDNPAYAAEL